MADGDTPNETSPLLQRHTDLESHPEPDHGVGVDQALARNGSADLDNDPLSRADSVDDSRAAQFKGQPEVYKRLKYIVPAVSIGVFLAAVDQTIIVTSYGRIGSDLNALNLTSWIATSYFLTLTSFQPLYGKLSDIFGRKACLLFAYAVFGVGSLCCGLSRDIGQLIAARVFQGVGGGGMTTVVSIMLSDVVPLQERGLWQGIINTIYAFGAGAGAPLGGLFADYVGWRWSFLCQAPLCLVAFVTVLVTLHLPHYDEQHWRQNLARIDFLGALVLVGAVFCLIFGMDRGSNVAWAIPAAYGILAASFGLFALFVYVEMAVAREPFAPGHVVFERSMYAAYLCNFFSFGGWQAGVYFLPLYYQAVDGYSATGAAVRLCPAIVAGVCGSLLGGVVMKRTGRYYWLTVYAYWLLVAGMLVILLSAGLVWHNWYVVTAGTLVASLGNGIGVTSSLIAIISTAAPADQAVATACSYLFRSLGSVMGIALSATVIQQHLRAQLAAELGSGPDAARIERGVRRSLDFLSQLDPTVRALVRRAYGDAVTYGFATMLGIVGGAAMASLFLRERKLGR